MLHEDTWQVAASWVSEAQQVQQQSLGARHYQTSKAALSQGAQSQVFSREARAAPSPQPRASPAAACRMQTDELPHAERERVCAIKGCARSTDLPVSSCHAASACECHTDIGDDEHVTLYINIDVSTTTCTPCCVCSSQTSDDAGACPTIGAIPKQRMSDVLGMHPVHNSFNDAWSRL